MMNYIYVLLSIVIFFSMLKYSYKYGVFIDYKSSAIGIIYILLVICYLGILNPKSKIYFLYDFFDLGIYPEYQQYIEYFTSFMALSLFFMIGIFIFFGKEKE